MTTQPEYKKPLPRGANPPHTKPFWEAAKNHQLVLPRCTKCSRYHFYPREECPHCFSKELEWVPASGKARLYSYTIIRQPINPSFADDVPYPFAMVQMDEGVRMISNIVGIGVDQLKVDMPLQVHFEDVTPEWTIVKWKPA